MTREEKVAFARKWFDRGECPGCGGALTDLAGLHDGHIVGGRPSAMGAVMHNSAVCPWSSDDLTSLVLIGGGFLPSLKSSDGAEAASRLPTPASVPSVPAS